MAKKISVHKTDSAYRRYNIVSGKDIDAGQKLAEYFEEAGMKTRSPLTGSRAYRLFKWSALWVGLVAAFLALIVPFHDHIESDDIARLAFRVAGGCLGVVGAFAAFIIFFGMLIYLFRHDNSATKKKILWLVLFLATAWFGSSIYFWVVYRKQVHQAA